MINFISQVKIGDALGAWFYSKCGEGKDAIFSPSLTPAAYSTAVEKLGLFLRFMPHCDWYRVHIEQKEDFLDLRIIHEDSWQHELATDTRALRKSGAPGWPLGTHEQKVAALANHGRLFDLFNGKVVLFGHTVHGPFTILDGNHRLLAYARALAENKIVWKPFDVFVGISMGPCRWHGDPVSWMERPPLNEGERRFVLNIW